MGDQMGAQGFSRDEFVLRMGRQDLANHLGMKIETISRTLTAMSRKGLIAVNRREVKIADRQKLDLVGRSGPGRKAVSVTVESASRSASDKQKTPAPDSMSKPVSRTKKPSAASRDAVVTTPWSGLLGDIGVADPVAA
jgi:DNA-binding transcriptional regulator YhcF (GntR family)